MIMKNKTYEELAKAVQHDTFDIVSVSEIYRAFVQAGHTPDKVFSTNSILVSKLSNSAAPIREAALLGLDEFWTIIKNYDVSDEEKRLFEQVKCEITQRAIVETVPGLQWLAIELLQPDACFYIENSL